MSDKFQGGILAGATSLSIPFVLRKTTDNTETTGKVAADFTLSYWRQGGTRTAITASDLGAVNSAYSSGGVKEVDATNEPGLYRLDVPDAAIATGADWVAVSVKCTGSYVFHERFALTTNVVQTGDAYARLGAPAGASVSADVAAIQADTNDIQTRLPAALVSGRIDASVGAMAAGTVTAAAIATDAIDSDAIAASAVTEIQAGLSTLDAAGVRAAIGMSSANLDTQLSTIAGYVDTEVAAIKAKTDNLPTDPADASDIAASFATVNSNLATVAGYIDTEIAAIKAKTDNLPASPAAVSDIPTAAQNADAVWDEVLAGHLTAGTTGAALNAAGGAGDPWSTALPGAYGAGTAGFIIGTNLDAPVSAVPDAADIRAAVGLASANLDTQLAAIDDAVDTEVAAIKAKTDNLPTDPADASDIAASFAAVTATLATIAGYVDTEVAAIKAKTDNLPASPAATGDAMTLTAGERSAVADALLARNIAGGSDGGRIVTDALRPLRNKTAIASGTLTVMEEDDTTPAWTATVTTAASDPLASIDPA